MANILLVRVGIWLPMLIDVASKTHVKSAVTFRNIDPLFPKIPGGYPAQGRLYTLITEVIVGSELPPNCRNSDQ